MTIVLSAAAGLILLIGLAAAVIDREAPFDSNVGLFDVLLSVLAALMYWGVPLLAAIAVATHLSRSKRRESAGVAPLDAVYLVSTFVAAFVLVLYLVMIADYCLQ